MDAVNAMAMSLAKAMKHAMALRWTTLSWREGWTIVDEGGCVNGVDVSVGVVPDEAAPGRGDSRSVLDWGG